MPDIPAATAERIQVLRFEMIDVLAEIQKAAAKTAVLRGSDDGDVDTRDRAQLALARDASDHYIRMGSLLRRMCDLVEPFLDEQ